MIAKLMSRKKSYDRIMRLDDGAQGRQHQVHQDLSHKKNTEVLATASRGGAISSMSRANPGGSTRKQLQYYDSTPQRKPATLVKKHLINSSSNQASLLDGVSGQNLAKQHGKSSAYLANSNSIADLH